MSYPRGQMDTRVKIFTPVRQESTSAYGQTQVQYKQTACLWAWVTFVRGARALNHGHIDAYQTIMVRCDVHKAITPFSRMEVRGKFYVMDSMNIDERQNECQITAYEVETIDKEV